MLFLRLFLISALALLISQCLSTQRSMTKNEHKLAVLKAKNLIESEFRRFQPTVQVTLTGYELLKNKKGQNLLALEMRPPFLETAASGLLVHYLFSYKLVNGEIEVKRHFITKDSPPVFQ
jgi:hypothetical protein